LYRKAVSAEKDLLFPAGKMPEAANFAFIRSDILCHPGLSDISDHILSILTSLINGFFAWRLKGDHVLSGNIFITHLL
jgi:hypothetical protein